jgi:pyruvate ferredoxin oxidoreductase beta subunit
MESCVFPIYEVEDGKYRMTLEPPAKRRPVAEYLKGQGRFRHLTPDQIKAIQERVDIEYEMLMIKVNSSKSRGQIRAEQAK